MSAVQADGEGACETKYFELRLLCVRHAMSYHGAILHELEPQLTDLDLPGLRTDPALHPSKFDEAKNKLACITTLLTKQSPPPLQLGSQDLRLQQTQVLAVPDESWLEQVKVCHCLRIAPRFSPALERERLDFANDSRTLDERGEDRW